MRHHSLLLSVMILLSISLGCSWFGDSANVEDNTNTEEPAAEKFTDAKAAYDEGVKLLETGETEKAIDALLQAVEIDPDHADAFFRLGIAYALVEFASHGPEADATPLPGEVRTDSEKPNSILAFERAVRAYRKQIETEKDDHAAYFNLGRSLNKLNRDEEASRALQQAVRLNPEDTEYQTELGAAFIKLAKYAEAERALRKAIELDENNLQAEELLERAEAGRKRIDFVKLPDDGKKKDANTNTNTSASETPKPDPTPAKTAPTPLQ